MTHLSFIWEHFKGLRTKYLLAIACIAAAAIFQFTSPLVIRATIDTILGGKPLQLPFGLADWIISLNGVNLVLKNIWIASIVLFILTLLANTFSYLKARLAAQASESFARKLKGMLYDHIQRLPFIWHSKVQTGDIIQRCTSDVDTVRRFLGLQLVEVGRGLIVVIILIPIMLSLSPKLTLVSIIIVPFIFTYAFFFFKKVRQEFLKADEAEGFLTTVLEEAVSGVRVVRSFARQDFETERFNKAADDYRNKCYRLIRILAWYWATSDVMCLLQIAGILVFGANLVIKGEISLGTLVVFMTYGNSLLWPIREMGRVLTDMGRAIVSLGRIREIFSTPQEDMNGKINLPDDYRLKGKIEFDNVCFSYSENQDILKSISITINPGETVAILGATGSGKSSLAHLIPRLFDISSGKILIDGVELTRYNRQQLRRQIGFVMQEPYLYSRTLAENIAIVQPDLPIDRVELIAQEVALHETVLEFEKGYDTIIGEKGITLSGGQRQRTAMARAMIANPAILILDDSLSSVDSETEHEIQRNLIKRKGLSTTIIITHRLTSVAIADRVIVLEHGHIAQIGTHTELLEAEGLYKRIWAIQHALEQEVG
jgi:ATP-binding cassette subfamily B protein